MRRQRVGLGRAQRLTLVAAGLLAAATSTAAAVTVLGRDDVDPSPPSARAPVSTAPVAPPSPPPAASPEGQPADHGATDVTGPTAPQSAPQPPAASAAGAAPPPPPPPAKAGKSKRGEVTAAQVEAIMAERFGATGPVTPSRGERPPAPPKATE